MIKLRAYYLTAVALGIVACSSSEEQTVASTTSDFAVLCQQFTALTQMEEYKELGTEQRGALLEEMLSDALGETGNAYLAWSAIRNGPPQERYYLFKEAATSVGHKDWTCPAIDAHGHEVGSEHQ